MKSLPSVGDRVKVKKGFKRSSSYFSTYDVKAGKTYKVVAVDDVNDDSICIEVMQGLIQWIHISEVKKVEVV